MFFFVLVIVCLTPLLRSLADSWDFPWFGNPDQDLVFLRDGFRLWRGGVPGYGDHPGLMQMVVVWLGLGLLSFLAGAGLVKPFPVASPADSDWQLLFLIAKAINVVLMAALLVFCAVLMARWLTRLGALVWAIACAMSMAVVAETYQLRNEFYSAFLVIAAMLIAVNGFDWWRRQCGLGVSRQLPFLALCVPAIVGSFLCSLLAFLAKVQVLPVMLCFLFAVSVGLLFLGGWRCFIVFALSVLLASSGVAFVLSRYLADLEFSSGQLVIVVIALAGPPALLLSAMVSINGVGAKWRIFGACISLAGVMVFANGFFDLAWRSGWIVLVVNPLAVRSYAIASDACSDRAWICALGNGIRGCFYLFERSVDSYLLAPLMAGLVLLLCAIAVVRCGLVCSVIRRPSRRVMGSPLVFAGCVCVLLAFGMAFVAGQRWPVDHYLPYQQPFLLAGLLMLSRSLESLAWVSRLALVLIVVSILLIYARYPSASRSTYVKEVLDVPPVAGRGDGSLCAPQHAGPEWQGSSLWALCNGFTLN